MSRQQPAGAGTRASGSSAGQQGCGGHAATLRAAAPDQPQADRQDHVAVGEGFGAVPDRDDRLRGAEVQQRTAPAAPARSAAALEHVARRRCGFRSEHVAPHRVAVSGTFEPLLDAAPGCSASCSWRSTCARAARPMASAARVQQRATRPGDEVAGAVGQHQFACPARRRCLRAPAARPPPGVAIAIASSTLFWMPRAMRSGATATCACARYGRTSGTVPVTITPGCWRQRLHRGRRARADDVEAQRRRCARAAAGSTSAANHCTASTLGQ